MRSGTVLVLRSLKSIGGVLDFFIGYSKTKSFVSRFRSYRSIRDWG